MFKFLGKMSPAKMGLRNVDIDTHLTFSNIVST